MNMTFNFHEREYIGPHKCAYLHKWMIQNVHTVNNRSYLY